MIFLNYRPSADEFQIHQTVFPFLEAVLNLFQI